MTSQDKPIALIIDDSPTATATYATLLSGEFEVTTAESRANASALLSAIPDVAVILCDYQLSDGFGTEVLRDVARSHPTAATALITAHGSLELAQESINNCLAHRFLQKGQSLSVIKSAMADCLTHHKAMSERAMSEASVLNGAVSALVESVCIQEPRIRRMSGRLGELVGACATDVPSHAVRDLRIASLVAYIGMLKVPFHIIHRVCDGTPIGPEEWAAYKEYPRHSAEMLRHFPKMKRPARFLCDALVPDDTSRRKETVESELLRACHDASWLIERLGAEPAAAVLRRDARAAPTLRRSSLNRVASFVSDRLANGPDTEFIALKRMPSQLLPGDALLDDLIDDRGKLLLARGSKLTAKMIENLRASSKLLTRTRELEVLRSMVPAALRSRWSEVAN